MRYASVIFDLDGTLVDSLPGIEASARYAIASSSPPLPTRALRDCIGPPIATMFAQLWPELGSIELERLVARFRKHYNSEGCLQSQLYQDVPETLFLLKEKGVQMFVLTNKPLIPSRRILQHLEIAENFLEVVSPDSEMPPFENKTASAMHLAKKYGLDPSFTLLLGDGLDDMRAAAACGFTFVLAAYGYGGALQERGAADQRVAETFSEISAFVL